MRLILTKLDLPGVYQFKVTVSTVDGSRQGDGYVNVTVKSPPRANHAPRAEIQPEEVTLQLPTNEAVLDGSSTYDTVDSFFLLVIKKLHFDIVKFFNLL